jgi:phospholipid/cholesterol/gamma-HCH transport system substrate-binding protein
MQAKLSTETLVGGGVIVAAAAFLLFAVTTTGKSNLTGSGGYSLSAEFDNVEGINVGTDVRLSGIKIGSVTGQSLNPDSFQAKLVMTIDRAIILSEDTSAKITSEGLLGGRFVALDPGGSDAKLADGGVISFTQGSVDMWSLISQAMFDKKPTQNPQGSTAPDDTPPQ